MGAVDAVVVVVVVGRVANERRTMPLAPTTDNIDYSKVNSQ